MFDMGTGNRIPLGVVLLLLALGAAVLLFAGVAETPTDVAPRTPQGPESNPAAPELIGGEPAPTPATPPMTPGPIRDAPVKTPTAVSATAWRIDFEVENAKRWQRAIFVPSTPGEVPTEKRNPLEGPGNGTLDVSGSGRLIVHAADRAPWVSDVLAPPPSGTLSITATMPMGLSLSGTVVAADGSTPVPEGHIQVAFAAPLPDLPHSSPFARWAKTDAVGRFHLTGLNPGRVSLRVRPKDKALGARTHVEATAGDTNLHIQLKPMGMVILKLFDQDTRQAPVTRSIRIEYPLESGSTGTSMTSRRGDEEAAPPITMRVANLLVGKPAVLKIRVNGYEPFDLPVELPPEGAIQHHDVPLQSAAGGEAVLLVTLRFEGANAPEEITVFRQASNASMGLSEEIVNGQLDLRVAPETQAVVIGDRESAWAMVTIPLVKEDTESGAHVERSITMRLGGHLRFTKDPPASKITLTRGADTEERWIWRKKDEELGWTVGGGLLPGTWTYRIEGPEETWVGDAQIKAGETIDAKPRVEPRPKPKAGDNK